MIRYTVADYLLDRLAQIGIRHLFGLPGDYNLFFLDHVIAHPEMTWVGCANELNAAYAADGYARCQPAAALLTTFGVGELSAINGIAGSYAEYLPVIHIVGAPEIRVQQQRALVHHTFGDGDFDHFLRMAREVTVAQALLTADNAAAEIDRVLAEALYHRRPVYLRLPNDVTRVPCTKATQPLVLKNPPYSAHAFAAFLAAARNALSEAKSVSLLADFLADRFQVREQVQALANTGFMPHATLILGKGLLDETHPRFLGTYTGKVSDDNTREGIEDTDQIVTIGVRFTDSDTCGFTHQIPAQKQIDIQPFEASVGGTLYQEVPMANAVAGLLQLVQEYGSRWHLPTAAKKPSKITTGSTKSQGTSLDQQFLWQTLQDFLRPGDIILAEQGTACYGAIRLRLPSGAQFVGQTLWGAIGYTLPAAYGMQTALPDRRVILLIGDGAAQLTIQEMGSMLRDGLRPIILLLNNDGYTIERAIHGPLERYNDIARWHWTRLPTALGPDQPSLVARVDQAQQLRPALESAATADRLALVEIILPRQDIPPYLAALAEFDRNHQ